GGETCTVSLGACQATPTLSAKLFGFSTTTSNWAPITPTSTTNPSARAWHSAVFTANATGTPTGIANKMYVFGGATTAPTSTTTPPTLALTTDYLWSYDATNNPGAWALVTTQGTPPSS